MPLMDPDWPYGAPGRWTANDGGSGVPRGGEPEEPAFDGEYLRARFPGHRVVLHDDDHNALEHVVISLMKTVTSLDLADAYDIALEAHEHGRATVVTCPREPAEFYSAELAEYGLIASVEGAERGS